MSHASLTVWKFETPDGAQEALSRLEALSAEGLISVIDAAVVSWEVGKRRPRTKQLHSTTGAGALGGAFWGLLFGLIFFVPLLGLAIGAATGALAGSLTDLGIDDDFIDAVRHEITPGTSALFLMASDTVVDRVSAELKGHVGELIRSNLSPEQEARLREAFEGED